VPAVNHIVEGVGGGWLVTVLLDLAQAYVVNNEELGNRPRPESSRIRAIGEPGMKVVEEVDAAGVAQADALLASAHAERLEQVALHRFDVALILRSVASRLSWIRS
jgi:hypothetical protein